MDEIIKELEKKIQELTLFVQSLESRISDLENGEFGAGVYLEGCNDEDKNYIIPDKKEGE